MIKVSHLVKNYGKNCAVDDISFEIQRGEIVGLLGPNGAGKSTTMNVLTGYLSSTSGSVSISGIDILDNPLGAKKLIGYLPEQPPLYLDMTVEEYLIFAYNLKNCTLNRERHLDEVCEVVKIKHVYKRLIKNLSKGYRQRVGIAQALIGNPQVIIFDEPTIGLDPKQIIEIRNLIRNLGSDHTVILSTHILQEVQAVCDRIIIVNKGKIVADEKTENITRAVTQNRRFTIKVSGPSREVLAMLKSKPGIIYAELLAERDGDAYTYTIESDVGIDIRKSLFYTLSERNWPLVGMEALGMSLEDIFITIVNTTDSPLSRKSKDGKIKLKSASQSKSIHNTENDIARNMMQNTEQSQKDAAKAEATAEAEESANEDAQNRK